MADTIPGNSTSTQRLAVSTPASGAIDFYGDTDWWKVDLIFGYSYQIGLFGAQYDRGSLYDPYLVIYNSIGNLQYAVDDIISGVARDALTNLVPNSSGYFFVSAQAFNGAGTGTYTIGVVRDQLASINSIEVVAINSVTADGVLDQWVDFSDWYRVTLTAGVQYQFDLIGSAADGTPSGLTLVDPWLALRNSLGAALLTNDDSG